MVDMAARAILKGQPCESTKSERSGEQVGEEEQEAEEEIARGSRAGVWDSKRDWEDATINRQLPPPPAES